MWAIIVSGIAAGFGWITLAGATVWYWTTVVPDLYDDQSVLPFFLTVVFAALFYLANVVGAWRKFSGFRDGQPTMILSTLVLGALIISTLTTAGILLIPSLIIATLAPAVPSGPRQQAPVPSGADS